jgi:hypothetical protein
MPQAAAHRARDHQVERWLRISDLRCRDRSIASGRDGSKLVAEATKQTPCRARAEYRRSRYLNGIDRSGVFALASQGSRDENSNRGPTPGRARSNARASAAGRSARERPVSERRSMKLEAVVMTGKSLPGRRDTGRNAVEGEGSTLVGHFGAKAGEGSAAEQYGVPFARTNSG